MRLVSLYAIVEIKNLIPSIDIAAVSSAYIKPSCRLNSEKKYNGYNKILAINLNTSLRAINLETGGLYL